MQVFRQHSDWVILEVDFEFLRTELLDQSFDFTRELFGHVIDCVRTLGLIAFQKITKPVVQHFDWMDCCHDYLPAFRVRRLSLSEKVKIEILGVRRADLVVMERATAIIVANAESEPKGTKSDDFPRRRCGIAQLASLG